MWRAMFAWLRRAIDESIRNVNPSIGRIAFPARKLRKFFAASVISSVVALPRPANRREQARADDRIRKR
jgi:hypothetical protein